LGNTISSFPPKIKYQNTQHEAQAVIQSEVPRFMAPRTQAREVIATNAVCFTLAPRAFHNK